MRKNNKRFLRRGIALLLLLFMILSPGAGFTSAAEPEDISVSGTAGADGTEDAAAGSGAVDAASDEAGEPASDGQRVRRQTQRPMGPFPTVWLRPARTITMISFTHGVQTGNP